MVLLFVILFVSAACENTENCSCNGDYNATYTDCPIFCPSTCSKPNAENGDQPCGEPGCACKPGYLLTEVNGMCIKPDDCPGGEVCKPNETFQSCLVDCPNIYCPVQDVEVSCTPDGPCPSGCGCKRNYFRKSVNEPTCIHVTECPPVNCTRPNEVWNPCTKPCFSDSCRFRGIPPVNCLVFDPDYCRPRCVCKKDFYRNTYNTCVREDMCPGMG